MSKNRALVLIALLATLGLAGFLNKSDSTVDIGGLSLVYFILLWIINSNLTDPPAEPPERDENVDERH